MIIDLRDYTTTRGNRDVPPEFNRQAEIDRLAKSIDQVIQRGGSVLIPVFALGRTQEILAMLALEMRAGNVHGAVVILELRRLSSGVVG